MPETDSVQFPRLYRAIKKKRWYDPVERKVLSAAFMLRLGETGLSVLKAVGCSRENCLAALNECYGEFVLETEPVRGLGLEVFDDKSESPTYSPNHAEITGLPPFEEKLRAEDRATELVTISILHYDRYDSYA